MDRNELRKLGVAVKKKRYRVGIDELLFLSHQITPSEFRKFLQKHELHVLSSSWNCVHICTPYFHLVSSGGILFEKFLCNYSSYTIAREFKRKIHDLPFGEQIGDADFDVLRKSEGAVFLSTVYLLLGNMGESVLRQKHYLSFLCRFKGITRTGQDIMSSLGWLSCTSSYDTWTDTQEQAAQQAVA